MLFLHCTSPSVPRSDIEADVVMEGGGLAAGDFSENLKQSNQELEEDCVKLQDVVDKMVYFCRTSISIHSVLLT